MAEGLVIDCEVGGDDRTPNAPQAPILPRPRSAQRSSPPGPGTGQAIAEKFPFGDYGSVIDIGCAEGAVPFATARAHEHLTGGGFDLPPIEPIFGAYVARHGLADRLSFCGGTFFADPLPNADVLIMGHILHDWDLDQKRMLLAEGL